MNYVFSSENFTSSDYQLIWHLHFSVIQLTHSSVFSILYSEFNFNPYFTYETYKTRLENLPGDAA